MLLFDYFRSSAAYRVRIALALKNLSYASQPVLLPQAMQQRSDYLAHNPHGLVPTLQVGTHHLSQSLAICEYLNEVHPEPPLLPTDPIARAQVRALALAVACDIHPLNNLRVQQYLSDTLKVQDAEKQAWIVHWITLGFMPLERQLAATSGPYCWGATPTLADICLLPQVYNAQRFGVDISAYPRIQAITQHCMRQPAFIQAHPNQTSTSTAA